MNRHTTDTYRIKRRKQNSGAYWFYVQYQCSLLGLKLWVTLRNEIGGIEYMTHEGCLDEIKKHIKYVDEFEENHKCDLSHPKKTVIKKGDL